MATSTAPSRDSLPATGYIRQPELLRFIPISPATLWRWVKTGRFISPAKLSNRVTAWRCEDVRLWIESQSQEVKR